MLQKGELDDMQREHVHLQLHRAPWFLRRRFRRLAKEVADQTLLDQIPDAFGELRVLFAPFSEILAYEFVLPLLRPGPGDELATVLRRGPDLPMVPTMSRLSAHNRRANSRRFDTWAKAAVKRHGACGCTDLDAKYMLSFENKQIAQCMKAGVNNDSGDIGTNLLGGPYLHCKNTVADGCTQPDWPQSALVGRWMGSITKSHRRRCF